MTNFSQRFTATASIALVVRNNIAQSKTGVVIEGKRHQHLFIYESQWILLFAQVRFPVKWSLLSTFADVALQDFSEDGIRILCVRKGFGRLLSRPKGNTNDPLPKLRHHHEDGVSNTFPKEQRLYRIREASECLWKGIKGAYLATIIVSNIA